MDGQSSGDALHFIGIFAFSARGGITLRNYQREVAHAVVDSVLQRKGLSFVVVFPRQSGKNTLQAQIEAYLLLMLSYTDAEIVKVSPTWKPQSYNAMQRLEKALGKNDLTRDLWGKEHDYIYKLGDARITFLSGQPESNIVGATASALLEVDEAQDVLVEKYDRQIAPMAASTNATRVFWGTAWTADTLLGRELRLSRQAQEADGIQRVFILGADEVAAEVPAYGEYVAEQVRRLGRSHPLVRTQFYSEELSADAGLFTSERLGLMQGTHLPLEAPRPGAIYALLVDVGGQARANQPAWQLAQWVMPIDPDGQDMTAATVVQVDLDTLSDPVLQAPTYRLVQRRAWQGVPHARLYGELKALAEHWQVQKLVIDATGLGLGLASFLERALGESRLLRFVFTQKSKSQLGWDFLSVVESGRFKDYEIDTSNFPNNSGQVALKRLFELQARHCQAELLPGPGSLLRWSVPENRRDPATGHLLHDDLLVSAALCARLDGLSWGTAESAVVAGKDVMAGMGEVF
jgi:hypothetical protein